MLMCVMRCKTDPGFEPTTSLTGSKVGNPNCLRKCFTKYFIVRAFQEHNVVPSLATPITHYTFNFNLIFGLKSKRTLYIVV